ncbi:class I SAM-dependent methyltransferase [Pedobacter nutrimenti]|uniref:class I SAM-dependent methyltransferase n=1 Tax=Pedobacter nutrimenti TaxID=1241337 RepID=UPI00292E73C7|nr:class I SAM-dependent methyltransferase [Pedobacter nutrimenti]
MESEHQIEQIREQQKQSWNTFSPGWKKWDTFNMEFLRPMGEAIIENLHLKGNEHVLDVATGTGEPGLTIAAKLPHGKVTGIDLSEDMLLIAHSNAQKKKIKNYETRAADVGDLTFKTESFDAVSCRMGFMFFPSMEIAATQLHRVLKPEGRISLSVWDGPEQNDWVTTIMDAIKKHVTLPPPLPGAPGMFRCAPARKMEELLSLTGFKDISTQRISSTVDYESFERYWEIMLDVAAPIVAAMSAVDEKTRAIIQLQTERSFRAKNKSGKAKLNYAALVISAHK